MYDANVLADFGIGRASTSHIEEEANYMGRQGGRTWPDRKDQPWRTAQDHHKAWSVSRIPARELVGKVIWRYQREYVHIKVCHVIPGLRSDGRV